MKNIKSTLNEIAISFALYCIFILAIEFLPALKSGPLTYFLSVAAGIKLFAILIFRWRGAVGTGLGIFVRLFYVSPQATSFFAPLLVAMLVSISLYLVTQLCLYLLRVDKTLANLTYYKIVAIATVTSIANAFVYVAAVSALMGAGMAGGILHNGFMVAFSNLAGNALIVCLAMLLINHIPFIAKNLGNINDSK